MDEKRLRHWFAFRLRTLLVLIVPLCAVLAWAGHSLNWIRERTAERHRKSFQEWPQGLSCQPPWQVGVFGEWGVDKIYLDGPTAKDVDRIERLFPESVIVVRDYRNGGAHILERSESLHRDFQPELAWPTAVH